MTHDRWPGDSFRSVLRFMTALRLQPPKRADQSVSRAARRRRGFGGNGPDASGSASWRAARYFSYQQP